MHDLFRRALAPALIACSPLCEDNRGVPSHDTPATPFILRDDDAFCLHALRHLHQLCHSLYDTPMHSTTPSTTPGEDDLRARDRRTVPKCAKCQSAPKRAEPCRNVKWRAETYSPVQSWASACNRENSRAMVCTWHGSCCDHCAAMCRSAMYHQNGTLEHAILACGLRYWGFYWHAPCCLVCRQFRHDRSKRHVKSEPRKPEI